MIATKPEAEPIEIKNPDGALFLLGFLVFCLVCSLFTFWVKDWLSRAYSWLTDP